MRSVSDTTANVGTVAATISTTTAYYLSTTRGLTSSATLLGSRLVAPLAPGTSDTGTIAVIVPASVPAGTYYIMAKADALNQLPESTETNNVSYVLVVTVTQPH